jgi:hypothetical protein
MSSAIDELTTTEKQTIERDVSAWVARRSRRYLLRNAAGEFYVSCDQFGRVEKTTGVPSDDLYRPIHAAQYLCDHLNTVRDCGADWSIVEVK